MWFVLFSWCGSKMKLECIYSCCVQRCDGIHSSHVSSNSCPHLDFDSLIGNLLEKLFVLQISSLHWLCQNGISIIPLSWNNFEFNFFFQDDAFFSRCPYLFGHIRVHFRVEAFKTNPLRYFAPYLKKYIATQIVPSRN